MNQQTSAVQTTPKSVFIPGHNLTDSQIKSVREKHGIGEFFPREVFENVDLAGATSYILLVAVRDHKKLIDACQGEEYKKILFQRREHIKSLLNQVGKLMRYWHGVDPMAYRCRNFSKTIMSTMIANNRDMSSRIYSISEAEKVAQEKVVEQQQAIAEKAKRLKQIQVDVEEILMAAGYLKNEVDLLIEFDSLVRSIMKAPGATAEEKIRNKMDGKIVHGLQAKDHKSLDDAARLAKAVHIDPEQFADIIVAKMKQLEAQKAEAQQKRFAQIAGHMSANQQRKLAEAARKAREQKKQGNKPKK